MNEQQKFQVFLRIDEKTKKASSTALSGPNDEPIRHRRHFPHRLFPKRPLCRRPEEAEVFNGTPRKYLFLIGDFSPNAERYRSSIEVNPPAVPVAELV